MLTIGITGSLASGKSTVASMFCRRGIVVLNADHIAHRAIFRNSPLCRHLIRAFGSSIVNHDRSINRKKLAALAFKNKKSQQKLCSVIHPWVINYIDNKLSSYRKKKSVKAVVVDAVLLIESGLYRRMDKVLVVRATYTQQLGRAQKMRGMTREQAKQRLQYQMPLHEKIKYADFVIDNRKSLVNTKLQVRKVLKKILENPYSYK